MEHTKLPWILKNNSRYWIKSGDNQYYIAHGTNDRGGEFEKTCKANAEFIVRAYNNHYQLIEACKMAQRFIDDLQNEYPDIPTNSDSGLDWDTRFILQDAIADTKK